MKTNKELIKWALEESPVPNKDIVTQLENLKLWSQSPTAYAKKISKDYKILYLRWLGLRFVSRKTTSIGI